MSNFDPRRRDLVLASGALLLVNALALPASAQNANAAKLKIGVIGSGHIGGTIGGLWVKFGHSVLFSSRHPEELAGMAQELGPLARAGTVQEAISFGEVVFLAVPYGAVPQIGRDYGESLKGKIIVDACNAVPARDGPIADEVESAGIGVTSQKYLPGSRLVRAFNTMSYMIFQKEANRAPPRLAVPIAGDDQNALKVAEQLVSDAGFDPVMVGDLASARLFQRGGPGYGQPVSASELRKILNLKN